MRARLKSASFLGNPIGASELFRFRDALGGG
jgi:hypothetical protein